jgi:hypothetical protein
MPFAKLNNSPNCADAASISEALGSLFDRLEKILLEENALLESNVSLKHNEFIEAKSQILRELLILQRGDEIQKIVREQIPRIEPVRRLIDRNESLLKAHVSVVNDIATTLTDAALKENADGTYSRND